MYNRNKFISEEKNNQNDSSLQLAIPFELAVTKNMIETSERISGGPLLFDKGRNSFYFTVFEKNMENNPDKLPKIFMKGLFTKANDKKNFTENLSDIHPKRSHSCGW